MHAVITHPFALEREMKEQYHAQPRTHCFCAHAREKQGCVMNHLQRKTVASKQTRHGMQGGHGRDRESTGRQVEMAKYKWKEDASQWWGKSTDRKRNTRERNIQKGKRK